MEGCIALMYPHTISFYEYDSVAEDWQVVGVEKRKGFMQPITNLEQPTYGYNTLAEYRCYMPIFKDVKVGLQLRWKDLSFKVGAMNIHDYGDKHMVVFLTAEDKDANANPYR